MKIIVYSLFIACSISSCSSKQKETITSVEKDIENTNIQDTLEDNSIYNFERQPTDSFFYSRLRNNEKLQIDTIYTDTVIFKAYIDYGDFNKINVIKNNKEVSLVNNDNDRKLNRGDIISLDWKLDSMWVADDKEYTWVAEFSEKVTKIKEGKLSLFKQNHPTPIEYYYFNDNVSSDIIYKLDDIYDLVQYYLANSKDKVVLASINSSEPNEKLEYSIEDQERTENGVTKDYTVIGIYNKVENHSSIVKWLFIWQNENADNILYEYDLPNDKLIRFD